MNVRPGYAWCFSHGRLHDWLGIEPWCTGSWVPLAGNGTAEALVDKENRFGGARFMHELPLETQVQIVEEVAARG